MHLVVPCPFCVLTPFLRNLNGDAEIKVVEVKTNLSGQCMNYEAGGFADEINVICTGDQGSVQRIFDNVENYLEDKLAINMVGSINIVTYLKFEN